MTSPALQRPLLLLCALLLVLTGCGKNYDTREARPGSTFKVGKPYVINGVRYVPKIDWNYDKIGIASWYGPGFHGRMTANGEKFDTDDLTAAHPTLPLPSVVKVTNLQNGNSVIVRVNDRGPFKQGRVLDVSKAAATRLGFIKHGIARVRVQILAKESRLAMAHAGANDRQLAGYQRYERAITSEGNNGALVAARNDIAPPPQRASIASAPLQPASATTPTAQEPGRADLVPVPAMPATDMATSLPITGVVGGGKAGSEALQPAYGMVPQGQFSSVAGGKAMPEVSRSGNIFVQAGAFGVRQNAEALASRLARIGKKPSVNPVKSADGGTLYRVRYGPYDKQSDAVATLAALKSSAAADKARIVHD